MDEEPKTAYGRDATYSVGPAPAAAPRSARGASRPAAIVVAHGMGQQIKFQTLDDLADGLCRHAGQLLSRRAETVQFGNERLQRLDLSIQLPSGERSVHVYEAYWAPLTEGRVTIRDVMAFMTFGALGGIRAGKRPFRRWLFDRYVEFPAPIRTVVYLEIALAVLASLMLLNALIAAVAAAHTPLVTPPAWTAGPLVDDLTTVLDGLLLAFAPFAIVLALAAEAHREKRPPRLPRWSVATALVAVWAAVAAGIGAAVCSAYHWYAPSEPSLFSTRLAAAVTGATDAGLLIAVAALLAWSAIAHYRRALARRGLPQSATHGLTSSVFNWFRVMRWSLIVFAAAAVLMAFRPRSAASVVAALAPFWHYAPWPLIVGITIVVRNFLVEYAGDVAAYVQPQRLDRFNDVRTNVKDVVARAVRAVYDAGYDHIILVGHSLGSVVMYDTLNALMLDAELAQRTDVVERTKLLLTFGSPLDKTAFIFGIQGTGSEPREALAASVQPMLTAARRPRWINIWSPWDIVSGHLDYYDLPERRDPQPLNLVDPDATTLLAAHMEYWNNPLLYRTIVEHL